MPREGAGIRFGQYMLLRRIARGGMAEVFLAQQRGLEGFDRRVAVKRILPHLADAPDFVKMFLGEAKLAAQLTHPNIVHIYDFGKVDTDYFIAMEYVEGVHAGDIFQHGADGDRLSPTMIARLGADAAAALHHAHELRAPNGKRVGLVHRDVSPANVMVSFDGVVKLCDFGIAKAAALSDQLTKPGTVKGKYAYMSPEQTVGVPLDGRSDVFALSIILWELLAGTTIVARGDAVEAMRAIRDGKLMPIEHAAPHTPAALASAITWGLQTKRERRPTAMELAQELEAFIKSSPELATPLQLGGWLRARFPLERSADADGPVIGTEAVFGTQAGLATSGTGAASRVAPIQPADSTGETVALPAPQWPSLRGGSPHAGEYDDAADDPFGAPAQYDRPGSVQAGSLGAPAQYDRPGSTPLGPIGAPARYDRPGSVQSSSRGAPAPYDRPGSGQPGPLGAPAQYDRPGSVQAGPLGAPAQYDRPGSGQPGPVGHQGFAGSPPFAGAGRSPAFAGAAGAPVAQGAAVAASGAESPTMIAPLPALQAPTLLAANAATVIALPGPPGEAVGGPRVGRAPAPGGIASTLYVEPATMAARARAGVAAASGLRGRGMRWMQPGPARLAVAIGGLVALALASFLIALAARGTPQAAAPADAAIDAVVAQDAAIDAASPIDAAADARGLTVPTAAIASDLEIRTRPDGATIKIAGQARGVAPTELSLPAGRYFIDAELEGWMPERRSVELVQGERVVQEIVFNTRLTHAGRGVQAGRLIVRTTPPSEVFLGTRRLADAPFDMAFDPGTYTLQLKHPRHATVVRHITITAGKTTRLTVTLP